MVSDSFIPASELNKITLFESGDGAAIIQEYLPLLAQVFVKHGMHKSYGLGYLHRHHELPEGFIWMHSQSDKEDRVLPAPITSLDTSTITGHTYMLYNGEFKPFEYETRAERQPLSSNFLAELKSIAQEHGLEKLITICPREAEFMFEGLTKTGQSAVPYDPSRHTFEGTMEDAQWCFDPVPSDSRSTMKGPAYIVSQRGCVKKPSTGTAGPSHHQWPDN